ncbi:aminomethyl-transferring glycine dehydrogenase [Fuerstiella marisgermanici]|uniref:Glycine dehydrogenase (decarboxylating) n=1 Tax=Fuerstiella marisgermanici TaxID=1891926 RepID=A0A1P8W930_9PLAN|nr:aminomethyl-transferring glycine dehydrogenase [Fuerstiella marisgermanici]APZ90573.1 Glycine dehydrogenase [decarboxylating] [Fuerstiella marisgermanici]
MSISSPPALSSKPQLDAFRNRHLGVSLDEAETLAKEIGFESLQQLVDAAVPGSIRRQQAFDLPEPKSETDALAWLKSIMSRNQATRSLIGMGYHDCITPSVILRNILENPGWYTAYTPYQPEISQGRLEACLNFQTMITELSGLDVANSSLLDEGTAAAEAMAMCAGGHRKANRFLVSDGCHPQTIAVLQTRAEPLGIEIVVAAHDDFEFTDDVFGVLVQYPDTSGGIYDFESLIKAAHDAKVKVVMAADLLALTLLKPPGQMGADIAIGNSQRFGVPLGFGGPHAAWIACTDNLKRKLPGRLVGVSKDANGKPAYRLALQTREQHIRRDKATSNICTAQVLLAVIASMYAVYHGPKGLREIAERVSERTRSLATSLLNLGWKLVHENYFDTLRIECENGAAIVNKAADAGFNLRLFSNGDVGITLDERTDQDELARIVTLFDTDNCDHDAAVPDHHQSVELCRADDYLQQPIFNSYHTETEMMRYLHRLEARDLALNTSMIPLGSCTMKLNAASEMMPLSWPEVNGIHPFAPKDQWQGYAEMIQQLEDWLAACTGFHAVSLQPNAGSQGEYAGLLAIREFHKTNNQGSRNVCLIPTSAHGTNPASAVMAGMKVVAVDCDDEGNIDILSLKAKAEEHADRLAALMVTYPSTHGVFEEGIKDICQIVHDKGGQVYMDGANLNAQLGLCSPGEIGADVCHLNLHKTFCIPHGGGGPGVGPIGVAKHLAPFLPGHPMHLEGGIGPVSAAPFGSASILTISWMYIAMMGPKGLTDATSIAILNANYIAHRLRPYFPVLYQGAQNLVAHECILDLRPFKDETGVEVEDVAKRLMDYGFHAPTMSWPVSGTLMIEPTESESKAELDRFCDAMISIHGEMMDIRDGRADRQDNAFKHAPHAADILLSDDWQHSYSREQAAYPAPWLKDYKYWPPVSRVDNVYGDRHLICTCPDLEDLTE